MSARVLVVCIGNICRSPTAEVMLRHYVPQLTVASAGLHALSGYPMDAAACAILAQHGLDGSRHVARQLHGGLVEQADLILGMEQTHLDAIAKLMPEASGRLFLLDHWRHQEDIADPYRRQWPAFARAYAMLDAAVQAWLPHLENS